MRTPFLEVAVARITIQMIAQDKIEDTTAKMIIDGKVKNGDK